VNRSGLIHLDKASDGTSALIAIGPDLERMHEFACGIGGARVLTPQGIYGVYEGAMDLVARDWFYNSADLPHPEPVSFGTSLAALEEFMYDVHDQLPEHVQPPVLLGQGQAASLAIALARVVPDYVSAVIAIGEIAAGIPGWRPSNHLEQLPILLVRDAGTGATADVLVADLTERGGVVTVEEVADEQSLETDVLAVVVEWLTRLGLR
jgi:hypothetical protein